MNIGIAGNGKIVAEMLSVVKNISSINIAAICVRPQSEEKGRAIAKAHSIPKVYTVYPQMLSDDTIDFIYVAVPNRQHYAYAKQALETGKNVICEKPFTVNAAETEELITLAKTKHLFLFEAITILYAPNFIYLKEILSSPDHRLNIGALRYVHANYAQYSSRYDRYLHQDVAPAFDPHAAGGALYDLNVYNLHFIIGLFGEPKDITYRANFGFNGIDTSGTALLNYDSFTAVCSAAKDSDGISGITFQGERGTIELLGAPNICGLLRVSQKNKIPLLTSHKTPGHRMIDEFTAFAKLFKDKDYDTCYANLSHSLLVMQALEKARLSSGLSFD